MWKPLTLVTVCSTDESASLQQTGPRYMLISALGFALMAALVKEASSAFPLQIIFCAHLFQ